MLTKAVFRKAEVGRMPNEHGLPPYTSKNAKTGLYQYYRRPPSKVKGSAFVRSYGSKDKKVVWLKYPKIQAEAEAYFSRLISGRALTDREIEQIILRHPMVDAMIGAPRSIPKQRFQAGLGTSNTVNSIGVHIASA